MKPQPEALRVTLTEELRRNPFKRIFYLPATMMPNITNIATQAAILQNRIDQTRVACALERYRLARGEYPEGLDALTPEYLAAIPVDVITRRPLGYRREGADWFVLWSVGENEVDDGGNEQDWVWGEALKEE